MDDAARQIRDTIRAALGDVRDAVTDAARETTAGDADPASERRTNIAAAVNVGRARSTTSVYVDDDLTIVEQDGVRRVVRRDERQDDERGS